MKKTLIALTLVSTFCTPVFAADTPSKEAKKETIVGLSTGAIIGGVVGGGAGILIGNKMDKQAQKIEEEIPGATVERVDEGIVVTFDENSGVYFDTAKYNVNGASPGVRPSKYLE